MKTISLQEGQSVYNDAQIQQLLSELDGLRVEKAQIIEAVKELEKVMPFDAKGGLDPMKIMGVVSSLQNNPNVLLSISFLAKYMEK